MAGSTLAQWMDQALCGKLVAEGEIHEDTFFPDASDREGRAFAQGICHECPVIDECKRYTLDDRSAGKSGVWGGLYFAEQHKQEAEERRRVKAEDKARKAERKARQAADKAKQAAEAAEEARRVAAL